MPNYSDGFLKVVDELFREMNELVPSALYQPAQVVQISGRISGTAFFPGGCGLYLEERDRNAVKFPVGGVMILGHNFDCETGFQKSLENGKEDLKGRGTWRPLLKLLKDAGIPAPEGCFFTNAFMGLCERDDPETYNGRKHPAFRAGCLKLLKVQIKTQRPRLILTLGPKVPPLLAAASPDLQEWNGRPRKSSCDPELHLEDLDRAPIFYDARIDLDDGSFHTAVITAVAHPSHPNSWRRKPLGFPEGRDGEMKLIRVGWDASLFT